MNRVFVNGMTKDCCGVDKSGDGILFTTFDEGDGVCDDYRWTCLVFFFFYYYFCRKRWQIPLRKVMLVEHGADEKGVQYHHRGNDRREEADEAPLRYYSSGGISPSSVGADCDHGDDFLLVAWYIIFVDGTSFGEVRAVVFFELKMKGTERVAV